MSFDKLKFAKMLNVVKGDRILEEWAEDSGIHEMFLHQFMLGIATRQMSREDLQKLLDTSYASIERKEFFEAAGYGTDFALRFPNAVEYLIKSSHRTICHGVSRWVRFGGSEEMLLAIM